MDIRYKVYSYDVMGIRLIRYYEYKEIKNALKKGIITPLLSEPLFIWGYPTVLEFNYVPVCDIM